tara:strand:- start:34 stop:462 length:429 start_codon:yes stop_codon:yes gene_type:complete
MSKLNVDTLTGVSTAGSISVTAEGNSTTTNLQQGLAKMFCNFDGTVVNADERDSFNVSSTDDDTTGEYGINYTNNMANTNYAGIVVGKQDGAGNNNCIAGVGITSNDSPTLAASLEIIGTDPGASAARDFEFVYAASLGDLA